VRIAELTALVARLPLGAGEKAALRRTGLAGLRGLRPTLRTPRAARVALGSRIHSHLLSSGTIFIAAIFLIGCAGRQPAANRQPAPPVQPAPPETAGNDAGTPPVPATVNPATKAGNIFEEGKASWYGAPFHGRQASNGEIYDMNKLTAAHRTLPFNTVVRVTNTVNGKSTTVRITDRGPFVDNRIIDLSYAAAKEISSIGPGVVPVRIEILSAIDPNAGWFTVQIGAFRERANAEKLRDRLSASYSPVAIQSFDSPKGSYYRVHVGKVSGEDAARKLGQKLHEREGVKPLIFRVDSGSAGGATP
jgi:peptidoglycan lytic transglycosylase